MNILDKLANLGQLNSTPKVLTSDDISIKQKFNGVVDGILMEKNSKQESPIVQEITEPEENVIQQDIRHESFSPSIDLSNAIIITKDAVKVIIYIFIVCLLIYLFVKLYINERKIIELTKSINSYYTT